MQLCGGFSQNRSQICIVLAMPGACERVSGTRRKPAPNKRYALISEGRLTTRNYGMCTEGACKTSNGVGVEEILQHDGSLHVHIYATIKPDN